MLKITRGGKEFFLRTYQQGDEGEIVELINNSLGTHETLDHWQWKYIKNPEGSLIALATDTEGTIIGHIALQKKRGLYFGEERSFFVSEDTAIRQEYQGLGISGAFPLLLPKEKFIIIGFPNSASLYSYKKFPASYTESLFFTEVPILKKKIDLLSQIQYIWRKAGHDSLKIQEINRGQLGLIDTLWKEKRGELSIGVIRDRRYLEWRIFDHLQKISLYGIFLNKICVGYFSVVIREKTSFITDILILNRYVTPLLIESIERLAYSHGARTVEIMINDQIMIKSLQQSGYLVIGKITCNHHNAIEYGREITSYITYSDTHLF